MEVGRFELAAEAGGLLLLLLLLLVAAATGRTGSELEIKLGLGPARARARGTRDDDFRVFRYRGARTAAWWCRERGPPLATCISILIGTSSGTAGESESERGEVDPTIACGGAGGTGSGREGGEPEGSKEGEGEVLAPRY